MPASTTATTEPDPSITVPKKQFGDIEQILNAALSNEQKLSVDDRAKYIKDMNDDLKKGLEQILARTDLPLVSFFIQSGVTAEGPKACQGEEGECLVLSTELRGGTGYVAIKDFSAVVVKQDNSFLVSSSTLCSLIKIAGGTCPKPGTP